MKDAYEVLYQKEADLARVRQEIESLTIAALLLADDDSSSFDAGSVDDEPNRKPAQNAISEEPTGTESTFVWPRSGFWSTIVWKP